MVAPAIQEKPARPLDLEAGSKTSGRPDIKKKSDESSAVEDTKTASSFSGEQGEEINYQTLSWW